MFGDQTLATIVWWPNILPFGHLVWCCVIVFDGVWSCLIKFEGHQTFISLFSCLMGNVLFVWTAAYQTCLMRACVPRLLSGLFQLFDMCLIKDVLTVWPLTSKSTCLVTKQCMMVIGRQTFPVCPGPKGISSDQDRQNLEGRAGNSVQNNKNWSANFLAIQVLFLIIQNKLRYRKK